MRSYYKPSCQEIADKAFKSHEPCYLQPLNGPSICDLCTLSTGNDFLVIFWTLKSTFLYPKLYVPVLNNLRVVGWGCAQRIGIDCFKRVRGGVMKLIRLGIKALGLLTDKRKRSADTLTPYDVADSIAMTMRWDTSVLDWFGFVQNANATTDIFQSSGNYTVTVDVMVAVKNAFVMNNSTKNMSVSSSKYELEALNDTVLKLQTAIAEGSLVLSLNGKTIYVTQITSCSDALCKNNQTLAVAPPYSFTQNTTEATPIKPTTQNSASNISSHALVWQLALVLIAFIFVIDIEFC